MFTEALFPVAKVWEQSKCPSIEEWAVKCVHTMEHDSVIKEKGVLPSSTARMHLEDTVLSEVSRRKRNAMLLHLYVEPKKQDKQRSRTETDS